MSDLAIDRWRVSRQLQPFHTGNRYDWTFVDNGRPISRHRDGRNLAARWKREVIAHEICGVWRGDLAWK
jgi:hypothetical protein